MRMVDLIEKKRDGYSLLDEEIAYFVKGVTDGSLPDYQISAFLMAVLFRGMNEEETASLTLHMAQSGDLVDLDAIKGIKLDKHSTGGVGDKTSLVLLPLVSACGGVVAKMSGRGLGHTGGTLDKMESVPGTQVIQSEEHFIKQVNDIGLAIIGQSKDVDPADKKLYALRDVTATVESLPLIASSIMSKKIASGADAILLDVKFGSGAFMKTLDDAKSLAHAMVSIGKHLGRDTRAIITDMDEPLGQAIGNSLEVKEAIKTLKGQGPKDLEELVIKAGGLMLTQGRVAKNVEEGEKMIEQAILDGSGYRKLLELFSHQGGDISYLLNPEKFSEAKYAIPVKATHRGYVSKIDCLALGLDAMRLGAGRAVLEDKIDMSAGLYLHKKVGDYVEDGETLLTIYTNKEEVSDIVQNIASSYQISDQKVERAPLIHEVIS